jgi:hypothetical protein
MVDKTITLTRNQLIKVIQAVSDGEAYNTENLTSENRQTRKLAKSRQIKYFNLLILLYAKHNEAKPKPW